MAQAEWYLRFAYFRKPIKQVEPVLLEVPDEIATGIRNFLVSLRPAALKG
jgi:hypothetical protein